MDTFVTGDFLYEKVAEIANNTKNMEKHLLGGIHVLVEIRDALRFANQKVVDRSVGEHRIGALRRISTAIDFISKQTGDVEKFEKIRRILLDISG